ncbi:MAG: MASE1 domain-containing protein [Rubrivivax sp.]|jgi:signal transduction histidine kinase|nr:MASE1 domain-containing protein [Rubrivivax sp.]
MQAAQPRWIRAVTDGWQTAHRALALPSLAVCLAFGLIYLFLDWCSYVYPMRGTSITAWNPQSALAVALLLHRPRALWVVGLVVPLAGWLWGESLGPAALLLSSMALLAGYVLTASLLRRFMGANPALSTRRDLLRFAALVCTGAAALALLYVLALWLAGFSAPSQLPTALMRRWLGETVSFLITLPLLFWLLDAERRAATRRMFSSAESWLLTGMAVTAAYWVFRMPPDDQLRWFYLVLLPAALAATRFGQTGAVWTCAMLQVLLILAVQSGSYRPTIVFDLHTMLSVIGGTVLLLGATVDEQRQSDERQRKAEQDAASAELAAALAHELQQPLTAMRNYARALELMAAREGSLDWPGPGQASAGHVTQRLVDEVNRASLVVQRLRDFFRRGAMELQAVRPEPLAQGVLRTQAELAASQGVTLDLVVPEPLPPLMVDAPQLEVVLRNLVVNAIEASAQAMVPDRRVTVVMQRQGDAVQISVSDVGPGLAAEQALAVFDKGHSSKPHGMGIGLAISRAIVHNHGGRLWAEAGPHGQFFLSLPLTLDEAGAV